MYKVFFKRFFDFCASFIGLVVAMPILIVFSIVLTFANGGNPFFFQDRPGRNGKIFRIIKFRTMSNKRDSNGNLLPDAERLHKIGKFVRSCSIDELPQMINILKGDMSFIGPRPLTEIYLKYYTPEQARRHDVRPGISGWAQVNGRNLLLLSKKFEYDVWYVDNISFKLDMKILFMTIEKIFKRSNVGAGSTNMKDVDDLNILKRIINDQNKRTCKSSIEDNNLIH